jgi:predicted transcriptional regulator
LEASSSRVTEVRYSIKILEDQLELLNSKLGNNTFNVGETKEFLITKQTYLNSELNKLAEIKNSYVKELQDIINN